MFLKPFYRAAGWLVKKFVDPESARSRKMEQDLNFAGREKARSGVLDYLTEKIAGTLSVLFWGTGICILAAVILDGGKDAKTTWILRPSYGEGTAETSLTVKMEGENEIFKIPLEIQERQYTDSELDRLFASAKDSLETVILGENESLDEVRSPLKFPASFAQEENN